MKGETTAPKRTIVLATLAPRDRKSVGYTSWLYVNRIEKAPLAHAREIVRANVNGAIGRPSLSTSKDRPRKMAQLIKLMLNDARRPNLSIVMLQYASPISSPQRVKKIPRCSVLLMNGAEWLRHLIVPLSLEQNKASADAKSDP